MILYLSKVSAGLVVYQRGGLTLEKGRSIFHELAKYEEVVNPAQYQMLLYEIRFYNCLGVLCMILVQRCRPKWRCGLGDEVFLRSVRLL
jgi:hypothetical protein